MGQYLDLLVVRLEKENTRIAQESKQCHEQNDRLVQEHLSFRELQDAAQYTAELLAKVPAFGGDIGKKVSKAQIGVALNRLMIALTKLHMQSYPDQDKPVLIEPFINREGDLCPLCDGTYRHEHPMSKCSLCGVTGLAENIAVHHCSKIP